MNIAVGSMFRDSTSYLLTYFAQQELLEQTLLDRGDQVRWIFAEDDSKDGTLAALERWAVGRDVTIEKRGEGAPYYPSLDIPERWKHIAHVANGVLDQIRPDDDVFVWVESDLLFDPNVIVELIDKLSSDRPILCPLLFGMNGLFYETHGTRVDGKRFSAKPPYHRCLENDPEFVRADSSGGCMVAYADVASQARYTPDAAYVGYAETLVAKGFPWTLACRLRVFHP